MLENQEVTSRPNTTTKIVTNELLTCPKQTVNGLFWPETEVRTTRTINCGQGKSKLN